MGTQGFLDKVKEWWSSFNYEGKPDNVLVCKLKALKSKLKEWNKGHEGNLGYKGRIC